MRPIRPSENPGEQGAIIVVCSPSHARLELICEWLVEHANYPLPAETSAAAERLCRYTRPAVIVLDFDLPGGAAVALLRERAVVDFLNAPVLLLAERGVDFKALMQRDPVLAVDDVLSKPFDLDELGRRITTILRRRHSRADAVVRVGELVVDPPRHKVVVGERDVHLAKKEFSFLRVLASDPTRIFPKDELLAAVWGLSQPGGTRTLDSHASRLRNKLDPENRRFVLNCWGVGYRLVETIAAAGPVQPGDAEGAK